MIQTNERQTGGQTDRDRQTRQTERQRDTGEQRHTITQTDRWTDGQTQKD